MRRRPPVCTRTDTPFPYTTLCRSTPRHQVDLAAWRAYAAGDYRPSLQPQPERREGLRPPTATLRASSIYFGPLHLRSEEHTSELQSLMRISYAVFCLKKKN